MDKKKLIYLVNARIPTEKAHGIQIMEMCYAFSQVDKEHFSVELVVPRRWNTYADSFQYYGISQSFKVVRIPCLDLISLGNNAIFYWIQTISFYAAAKAYLSFKKFDFLYSRDLVSALFFREAILEIHWLPKRMLRVAKYLVTRPQKVIALTASLKMHLVALGVKEERVIVEHDGVNLSMFMSQTSRQKAREELELPSDMKVVTYTGSFELYDWKGVDVLLGAAELAPKNVLFVFVGARKERLEIYKKKYGHLNTRFICHEPHSRIPMYLRASDVVVLPNKTGDIHSEKYTSPLKLFEYMASGTPIVATRVESLLEVLEDNDACLVEPNNSAKLWEGIHTVLSDTSYAKELSDHSLDKVKKYAWNKRAEKIYLFMRQKTFSRKIRVGFLYTGYRAPVIKKVLQGESHAAGFWGMFGLRDHDIETGVIEIEDVYPLWLCSFMRNHISVYNIHLPVFWKIFSYDIIFTSTGFGTQLLRSFFPFRRPLWVMHDFSILGLIGNGKTIRQRVFMWMVSRCAGIVTLGKEETEKLKGHFPGLASRITHIPFGVDLKILSPSLDDREMYGVFAVGFDPDRDWKTLVDAMDGLNVPLTLATLPSRVRYLEPLPAFVSVKRLSFKELIDAYKMAQIVVIPLDTSQGINDAMGCSTLFESLAMGKPTVVTRTHTTESYVTDGENGLLIEERNVPAMRSAIVDLLDYPHKREHLAYRASLYAKEYLDMRKNDEKLAQYFKSLFSYVS